MNLNSGLQVTGRQGVLRAEWEPGRWKDTWSLCRGWVRREDAGSKTAGDLGGHDEVLTQSPDSGDRGKESPGYFEGDSEGPAFPAGEGQENDNPGDGSSDFELKGPGRWAC